MLPPKLLLTLGFGLSAAALAVRHDQQDPHDRKDARLSQRAHGHGRGSGTHFAPTTVTSTLTPQVASSSDLLGTDSSSTSDLVSKRHDSTYRKRDINPQHPDHDHKPTHVPADEADPTPQHPPRHDAARNTKPSRKSSRSIPAKPKSSVERQSDDCDPLDPLCLDPAPTKREQKHISGTAGRHLTIMAENKCRRTEGDLWLDCMNDFQDGIMDYFDARKDNDEEDVHEVPDQYHDAGIKFYNWATEECTLTEASDSWDECMDQFKDEVDDRFDELIDYFTDDDILDGDVPKHKAIKRTTPDDAEQAFQDYKTFLEQHCEELNRPIESPEGRMPCDDLTATMKAQYYEMIIDCKSDHGDAWPHCVAQFFNRIKSIDMLVLEFCAKPGLSADDADRCMEAASDIVHSHSGESIVKRNAPEDPFQKATVLIMTYCQAWASDNCSTYLANLADWNAKHEAQCKSDGANELQQCVNQRWQELYQQMEDNPLDLFDDQWYQTSLRRAVVKRDTSTSPFEKAKASIIEFCQTHTDPNCEATPEKESEKLDETNRQMEAECKSTAGDAWQKCANRGWQSAYQAMLEAAGDFVMQHNSIHRPRSVVKRSNIPDLVQSDIEEFCQLQSEKHCQILQQQGAEQIEDLITAYCTTEDCADQAWQLVHEAYQKCKSSSDAAAAEQCLFQKGEDLGRFLVDQGSLSKRHDSPDPHHATVRRSAPDDIQNAVDEACKQASYEQCETARAVLTQIDTLVSNDCDNDDCADQAWDILRKTLQNCKGMSVESATDCTLQGFEELKQFLADHADLTKRDPPAQISTQVEQYCQSHPGHLCQAAKNKIDILDSGIDQYCQSTDAVAMNECVTQTWNKLDQLVNDDSDVGKRNDSTYWLDVLVKRGVAGDPKDDVKEMLDAACAQGSTSPYCDDIDSYIENLDDKLEAKCKAAGTDDPGDCVTKVWETTKQAVEEQFKQAGIAPPQKRDEWTHWACSRGVQWACQYPDFEERDRQPPVDVDWVAVEDIFNRITAHVACGLGNDEACEYVQSDHQKNINNAGSPVISKRDDDIPTDVGERITHTHTSQGQTFTAVLELVKKHPTVFHDTFYASGTKYEVKLSQMSNDPTSVAQTIIYGGATNVRWTSTDNTASIGKLTSIDFGAYAMAKRTAPTSTGTPHRAEPHKRAAEPPHTAPPSVHYHLEKDAFSSWLVENGYMSPDSLGGRDTQGGCPHDDDMLFTPECDHDSDGVVAFMPARRDANHVETMIIVDQRPGHTTLNPEVAMQREHATTGVTVVHVDGIKHTLFPTTNSNGDAILATESYVMERAKETVTATVVHWPNAIRTYRPGRMGTNVETATIHVTADMTVPVTETTVRSGHPRVYIPGASDQETIDAPVPKIPMLPTATVYRTITKVKPYPSGPLIIPSDWDMTYTANWENIMEMPLAELKDRHPYADWDTITRRAAVLRSDDPVMNEETSMKIAFIMMNPDVRHRNMLPPVHDDERPTQWVAVRPKTTITRSGSTIPITASTQMIAGTPYVVDPLYKYSKYHAYSNNVAPTGSCHEREHWWRDEDGKSHWPKEIHEHNETECHIERCMWDFMKPINITTVTRGYLMASTMEYNYFTYWTELRHPHWGTQYDRKVYYPMTKTHKTINGTISTFQHRATPDWMNEDMAAMQRVQMRGPMCRDIESCHRVCAHHHRGENWFEKNLTWALPVGIALLLLPLILCCCLPMLKRQKNKRQERKNSEKPQNTVVNQVNGQPTDPAGNPVSPETAAAAGTVAGSAAGAEAARQDQAANEDGRGTTGRRAEEGRGRVNFEDGGHPGQDSGEHVGDHPAGEQQQKVVTNQGGEQHAEPQPVPDHDGAGDGHGTGRQGPDVGSMRGRKRNRPEGIAGLGF